MRAMKRTVSVLLSLMLVLGMMTIGMSVASAAETKVTATSNIGATASADYTASSEQVTVTYKLNTAATISGVRAVITYDKAVLKLATTNTAATCFPTLNESLVANLTKTDGRLPFNASSYNGYSFAGGAVLATVVFDIIGTGNTTVDLEVKDLISITNAPSQIPTDEVVIIDDETNDTTKYTATAEVTVSPSVPGSNDIDKFIYSRGVNLKGKIGFQFIFYANPEGYNASDLTISIQGPHDDQNINKAYSSMSSAGKIGGVSMRQQAYFLMASYLSQDITIIIYNGPMAVASETLNIADFASDFIETHPTDNRVPIFKAMLNYGAYSQLYLNKFTDNLADKRIEHELAPLTADQIQATPNSPASHPTPVTACGFKLYAEGVELGSQNAINIYLQVTDATKFASASATIDGNAATISKVSGNIHLLKVADIAAKDMDSVHTIAYSDGTTYKVSILSYLKSGMNTDKKDVCTAMYWYYAAAKDYFSN